MSEEVAPQVPPQVPLVLPGFEELLAAILEAGAGTGRRLRRAELDALRAHAAAAAAADIPIAEVLDAHFAVGEAVAPALRRVDGHPPTHQYSGAYSGAVVLVRALRATSAALLRGYADERRRTAERDERARHDFIDALLGGHADPVALAERAERFGVLLAGRHVVTVARSARRFTRDNTTGREVTGRIEVALVARFGARNVLVTVRDSQLVCITPAALRGTTGEIAHKILECLGTTGGWQLGVGRAQSGPTGVLVSYDEARNALHLADRLGLRAQVLHAADLLVFPVLLRDRHALTDLITTVLGPLTDARGGPQPLLDTLTTLFACHGNTTATAHRLGISARAVTYRLERIHKLTGYAPTDPTQRFTLEAAVLGARLLNWPTQPI